MHFLKKQYVENHSVLNLKNSDPVKKRGVRGESNREKGEVEFHVLKKRVQISVEG